MEKQFKVSQEQFHTLVTGHGSCFASDRITVDGVRVGYMYREAPDHCNDSGWRFFSGDESQEYAANPQNLGIYDLNTIANYDPEITPFLDKAAGTAWDRTGKFIQDQINPIE